MILKKNYIKLSIAISVLMICISGYSQNLKISIVNAQNTSDGPNNYYEADIMIQTIDGQSDFKLGSGQVYFNYNTAAFGDNVGANNRFEVSADYDAGYILGEKVTDVINIYNISSFIKDNTASRVSWSFSQKISSGGINETVGSIPVMMVHIKLTYVNASELPLVTFEDDETLISGSRDQFYTACGPFDSASASLDCTGQAESNQSTQFFDAIFESSGATLATSQNELGTNLSIFPNPTNKILNVSINIKCNYSIVDAFGKLIISGILEKGENKIDLESFEAGVYFVNIKDNGSLLKSFRVIKR